MVPKNMEERLAIALKGLTEVVKPEARKTSTLTSALAGSSSSGLGSYSGPGGHLRGRIFTDMMKKEMREDPTKSWEGLEARSAEALGVEPPGPDSPESTLSEYMVSDFHVGPYMTHQVMAWKEAQVYINLRRAYMRRDWKLVASVLGLSARCLASSEQAALDAGDWVVAYRPLGITPPAPTLAERPSPEALAEDDSAATLAAPQHVAVSLQAISDSSSLKKKRTELRAEAKKGFSRVAGAAEGSTGAAQSGKGGVGSEPTWKNYKAWCVAQGKIPP